MEMAQLKQGNANAKHVWHGLLCAPSGIALKVRLDRKFAQRAFNREAE
jgi:hypothetical protein